MLAMMRVDHLDLLCGPREGAQQANNPAVDT